MAETPVHEHLDWAALLPLLGVPVQAASLPVAVLCPFCNKHTFRVYHDHRFGGQWASCAGGCFSGTLFELCQTLWRLSPEATLKKLQLQGFLQDLSAADFRSYLLRFLTPLNASRRFWQDAQDWTNHGCVESRELANTLGLPSEARDVNQLLGVTTYSGRRKLCHPGRPPGRPAKQKNVHRLRQDTLLAVPYYDLPGRITAIQFIGRKGEYPKDWKYHNLYGRQRPFEAGLAFHPAVPQIAADYENRVLIVNDLLLHLRWQLSNLRNWPTPLPLAQSWLQVHSNGRQGSTQHAFDALEGAVPVLWMPAFDVRVLQQAILADGLVSTAGPSRLTIADRDTLWKYVRLKGDVRASLNWVFAQAVPWPEALSVLLRSRPEHEVQSTLLELALTEPQRERLRDCMDPNTRCKMDAILEQKTRRTAEVASGRVSERPEGWFSRDYRGHAKELFNAILRIDHIVRCPEIQKTRFLGRVLYKGAVHPFDTSDSQFAKHPFQWLQDRFIAEGKGVLRYCRTWHNRAIAIAAQMHAPVLAKGTSQIGWFNEADRFVFPDFDIANGEFGPSRLLVRATKAALPDWTIRPVSEPLQDFHPPSLYYAELFWAAITSAVAMAVAPMLRRPTRGVLFYGDGASCLGGAVAGAIASQKHPATQLSVFEPTWATPDTRWPIWIFNHAASVFRHDKTPVFASVDRLTAAACFLAKDWRLLQGSRGIHDVEAIHRVAPLVVFTCLQRATSPAFRGELLRFSDPRELAEHLLRTLVGKHYTSRRLLDPTPANRARILVDIFGFAARTGRGACRLVDDQARPSVAPRFVRQPDRSVRAPLAAIPAIFGSILAQRLPDQSCLLEWLDTAGALRSADDTSIVLDGGFWDSVSEDQPAASDRSAA